MTKELTEKQALQEALRRTKTLRKDANNLFHEVCRVADRLAEIENSLFYLEEYIQDSQKNK